MLHPLAFHLPFLDQSGVLLILGLLIFGKRLPEVGRSLGKGIVEFKRGIKGLEDDVEQASTMPVPAAPASLPAGQQASSFKFDPHTGQPIEPPVPTGGEVRPLHRQAAGGRGRADRGGRRDGRRGSRAGIIRRPRGV